MYGEAKEFKKGELKTSYYEERLKQAVEIQKRLDSMKKVVKPEEMPWEICREGKLKHIANEKMDVRITAIDVYIQEIPPGSRSGKHRHMTEERLFVLEGKGYDLHWDPDLYLDDIYHWDVLKESKKFEWEEGDCVIIPPMVVHQHFNTDHKKPARVIIANGRLHRHVGCPLWEQIEDAPEYKEEA
ncbi:hypothetical protein ACFL4C_02585 [Candidatus Omnitrophota bacterium]